MILDDAQVVRGVLGTILDAGKYRVLEAGEGAEALRLAIEKQPDLILMDWNMPGMSGIEFVETLRKRANSSVPCIILTGTDPSEIENRSKALGACSFLRKPFSAQELLEKVETALK